MEVTVGYLLGQPHDFKTCQRCKTFNWYENRVCWCCGSTDFQSTTQEEVEAYAKARAEDEHFCDECAVTVA